MNRRCTLLIAALAAVCLVVQRPASAQLGGSQQTGGTGMGSGTTGRTGRSTGTAAGVGSTVSQTQGYGLDSRFTGNGFNRYTTGSAGMGQTTAGAGAATSGAFGQSANQQGAFGNLGGMGGMGGMGLGGMMGMNRGMMMGGMRGMGGMGGMQGNQQGKGKVRTHLRLGFSKPRQSVATINTRLSGVVQRVLNRPDIGGGQVTVSMEGSTAVLTGTVSSEHARGVVESLAMLEPGIAEVRNELLVSPGEPTPETEPTSSTGGQPQ